MLKPLVMTALTLVFVTAFAAAAEKVVKSTDIKPARPQIPLLGEIRESEIPVTIFYKKQKPLVSEDFLLTAGYLTSKDRPFGRIVDTQTEGDSHSMGDILFINRGSSHGVEPGDRFFVYRRMKEIRDPDTKKRFGHIVTVVGLLEVAGKTRIESADITAGAEQERRGNVSHVGVRPNVSSVRIVKSYTSVLVGDYIIPEFNLKVPMVDPDSPIADKSIEAKVVAVSADKNSSSQNDVIYLNIGRKGGVSEGDVFAISPKVKKKSAAARYGIDKRVAKARVIMARPDTSTAVIFTATSEIFAGDRAKFLQER